MYTVVYHDSVSSLDKTYPVILQNTGVTPEDYEAAITNISTNIYSVKLRQTLAYWIIFAVIIFSILLGGGLCGGSLALVLSTGIDGLWALFAVACVFSVLIPTLIGLLAPRCNRRVVVRLYAEIQEDVALINQNLNENGVQFILKVDESYEGSAKRRHRVYRPYVEVVVINKSPEQVVTVIQEQPYVEKMHGYDTSPIYQEVNPYNSGQMNQPMQDVSYSAYSQTPFTHVPQHSEQLTYMGQPIKDPNMYHQ